MSWPPSWWPPALPYQYEGGDPVLPGPPHSTQCYRPRSTARTVEDVLTDWHRYERAHGRGRPSGRL